MYNIFFPYDMLLVKIQSYSVNVVFSVNVLLYHIIGQGGATQSY
jgi:hypothetical protein